MQITVIGSGDMNSRCMSASYAIDGNILVDLPNGVLREMARRGTDPLSFSHVLITHLHGDHVLDLPVFLLEKSKRTEEEKRKVTVYAQRENLPLLRELSVLSFRTSLTGERTAGILSWNGNDEETIGDCTVTRVPVRHGILPDCSGYLLQKDGATVGFTGDTCLTDSVYRMAAVSDILFCDCDLIRGNDSHMGIDDLGRLHEKFPRCRLVAGHLKDETREELLRRCPEGITVAEDGMVFETEAG